MVDRLMKKEDINDKVEVPLGTFITINLGEINTMNISYNADALGSANTIIQ